MSTSTLSTTSAGGNTFAGTTAFVNNGSGTIIMANAAADTYSSTVTGTNAGTGSLHLAYGSAGNSFGGDVTLNNSATGTANSLTLCNSTNATATIPGNLVMTNTGSGTNALGVAAGTNSSAAITGNVTITSTAGGTGSNSIYLAHGGPSNVTIGGDLSITNANTASINNYVYIANSGSCTVTGSVTVNNTSGGTNSGVFIAHSGTTTVMNIGGSFNINNSGSASGSNDVYLANNGKMTITGATTILNGSSGASASRVFFNETNTASTITFNGDVTLSNNSTVTGDSYFRNLRGAVAFNGNLVLNNTATTASGNNGFYFCWAGYPGTATLANTKTITVGASGFSTGTLQLLNFTQIGSTPQSLALTGTVTQLIVGPSASWGASAVTFSSPSVYLNGATYAGTTSITKTGAANNASIGNNTFTGISTIVNSGAGIMYLANTAASPDYFLSDVTATNSGAGALHLAYGSAGNTFGGNVTMSNSANGAANVISVAYNTGATAAITGNVTATSVGTGTANAIAFANNAGSNVTIAGNLSVSSSSTGSSTNNIYLGNSGSMAITGSVTVNNTASGTSSTVYIAHSIATASVTIGGSLSINNSGSATTSNEVYMTYNGGYMSVGGPATIINGSSGAGVSRIYLNENSSTASIVFNGDVTLSNISTVASESYIRNLRGTISFNGNLVVNNTATTSAGNNGIYLGWVGYTGNSTLANTKTITVGATGFSTGTLQLLNFTQIGSTSQSLALTGTITQLIVGPSSSWGAASVVFSSPSVYLNGASYAGTTSITKTGAANNASNGGNTFTGVSTIVNSGAGIMYLSNVATTPDNFVTDLTATNSGAGSLHIAYNSPGNTIGGNLLFTNSASGPANTISVAYGAGATAAITGNVTVNSVGTGTANTVTFSNNAGSTTTIGGNLSVTNACTGSGNNYVYIGNGGSAAITGSVTVNNTSSGTNSAILIANGASTTSVTIGGSLSLNNAGSATAANDVYIGNGGASTTIGGTTSIINNGSGAGPSRVFLVESTTGATITYNGDATFSNISTSTNDAYIRNLRGASVFNGNLIVNNTATTASGNNGIYLCWSSGYTGTASLASGKTVTVGSSGFSTGRLQLQNFTQNGSTPQSLTLTGTTTTLQYGPGSSFGGNVTSVSPGLLFNGCTFAGTTTCTKNGSANDAGSGTNVFSGVSVMNNTGSGYLMFGNGSRDQWLTNATFNNSGSSYIYLAHNSTNNVFGGNVTCNNTSSANGIYICNSAASTASVTGNFVAYNDATGGTNSGIRAAEANNASFSVGGTTTITNTSTNSSNYIRFSAGTNSASSFGGDVTVTNNGSAASTNVVHFAFAGTSTFGGNIILNSTGGAGVVFGASGGTSTQANGKTINTGTFSGGPLYIRNFTQSGSTTGNTSNVSITGTNQLLSILTSSFYDNMVGSSQMIDCNGSTFRGNATLTKTGGNANNAWTGGNTFNGTTTITNQSATYNLAVANGTADIYNGDVTFVQSAAGLMRPSYLANCLYYGNITASSPSGTAITFGSGGAAGITTLSGGNAQTINLTSGTYPIFAQLVTNKTAGTSATLNTRINISGSLTMTSGMINTTSANILNMNNGATTTVGNSSSYINGPMNYDMAVNGARTLNFPIGKTADWRPVTLALTHNANTSYTYKAEVFNAAASTLGWALPATVDTVSGVHYWDIDRSVTGGAAASSTNLSGNQVITLYFDVNDYVYQGSTLTICKNTNAAPTTWFDIGGSSSLGNFSTPQAGSVTSTSSPTAFTSFSRFTLGSRLAGWNSLPVDFLYFKAKPAGSKVALNWATASETNNDRFEIERSQDGASFQYLGSVKAHGNGSSVVTQLYDAIDELPYGGTSYYRLKQVDRNGAFKYSGIAQVDFTKRSYVNVYPNPATSLVILDASEDYLNASVKIVNMLGVEMSSIALSSYTSTLDISSLPSGLYYVIIDNGFSVNKIKLTVQK